MSTPPTQSTTTRLPCSPLGKLDVAVIVPTRNSARTLSACLKSIRAQRLPCTLVVVDNGSTDETPQIARELADLVLLDIGPERSAQRNAGAAATAASIVGFIDSDMVLPPELVAEAVAAIQDGAASVIVPERTIGEGFWADVRAYERTFYQGSDAIEAPRFFPRAVFDRVGGFDEALTGPEDWDLGLRTAEAGRRIRITATILHHEGRVRYLDACRKKAYYAPGLARFFRKHGALSLAQASRRPWLAQPRTLVQPLGIGLLVLKCGEVSAVAIVLAGDRLTRRSAPASGANRRNIHSRIRAARQLSAQGALVGWNSARSDETPSGIVVFMTGPLGGFSGGDVHAFRLAEYWTSQAKATVMAPPDIPGGYPPNIEKHMLALRVPLESYIRQPSVYLWVLFARAVRYSLGSPSADVTVAASHLTGDVVACMIHRLLHGSMPVVYVHHLVGMAGRRRSLRSLVSAALEKGSLNLVKGSSSIFLTGDRATHSELLRRGFAANTVHLTANAYEPLVALPPRTPNPSQPSLVFCGRLTEEKGVWDVVDVARKLHNGLPSARIDILGDGPLRSALVSRLAYEGLNNVFVRGFVPEEEKWAILRSAHLFFAPSREEGWGIAVGEALTAGIPVVAYDLPAYAHFGEAVIRVSRGDVDMLASTLLDLLLSPEAIREASAIVAGTRLHDWESILEAESGIINDSFRLRSGR